MKIYDVRPHGSVYFRAPIFLYGTRISVWGRKQFGGIDHADIYTGFTHGLRL